MNNSSNIAVSPLNGTKNIKIVNRYRTKDIIDGWQKSFNVDIKEEMLGIEEIILYECNQTKLRFFHPPDAAGSRAIYEQLQNFDWYYMSDKWEFDVALNILSRSTSILEIGSAFGTFVKKVSDAGLNIKGIEINESAVEIAKEQGLPVERVDIHLYADEYPESFDAMCSFQVLEHIPNPKSFIESSIKILKKNGILIFSVPNSESFLKYQYNLLDMPPHHMTHWSEVAFRALEHFSLIKLEKVFYEPLAAYHVSGYLNAYAQHYKSMFRAFKLVFNRYTLPILAKLLNLGEVKRFFRGQTILVQFRKL
jgi:2-polyprenyl-3-methyl-5-hydroxy-6-metoxy-1,4-benzoquinol methylase